MEDPVELAAAVEPQNEAMMAVVSGESDGGLSDDEDPLLSPLQQPSSPRPHDCDPTTNNNGSEDFKSDGDILQSDENHFYGEDLDDDDEAYVYKNLRGGKPAKTKTMSLGSTSSSQPAGNDTATPTLPAKPRNSDAVLSCPCCFSIVCMDCQRHVKYENQFRAMFVMGIEVDWQHRLVHDTKSNRLIRYEPPTAENGTNAASQIIVPEDHNHLNPTSSAEEDTIYYAVSCGNCHTMVAALDMGDEVYHFYDCLASS